MEGVIHAEIDVEEHKVAISYERNIIGPRSLIQSIQEAGHGLGTFRKLCTLHREEEKQRGSMKSLCVETNFCGFVQFIIGKRFNAGSYHALSQKSSNRCTGCLGQTVSENPIAKAVVDNAKKLGQKYGSQNKHLTEVKDFEVHPGAGVSGKIGERTILIGNKWLMRLFNVTLGSE